MLNLFEINMERKLYIAVLNKLYLLSTREMLQTKFTINFKRKSSNETTEAHMHRVVLRTSIPVNKFYAQAKNSISPQTEGLIN